MQFSGANNWSVLYEPNHASLIGQLEGVQNACRQATTIRGFCGSTNQEWAHKMFIFMKNELLLCHYEDSPRLFALLTHSDVLVI